MTYFRPLAQTGDTRPSDAVPLAGGPSWFSHAEQLGRNRAPKIVPVCDIPDVVLDRLTVPRAPIAGIDLAFPRVMGILNVTPDSFSDGGHHFKAQAAIAAGRKMIGSGADIIDIGGESTRPGAEFIESEEEIRRTAPVVAALRAEFDGAMSIDTRKAPVALAALEVGATLVNDVSGFTFDPDMAKLCAARATPVCVMHSKGDPATMQEDPCYDNVVLDVYDFLDRQIARLAGQGISRDRIIVDPGIGFGKTIDHNIALLQNISIFHGLGCAILLGVSRKGFIGTIGNVPLAQNRGPGSLAVGLAATAQGVQILRVHDVAETVQALRLWRAVR